MVNGIKFDSGKEAARYLELLTLERAGKISDLRLQVPYELIPKITENGKCVERAVKYVADFVYQKDGETVVEDVKGYRDPCSAVYAKFVIKRKLMLWLKGIKVVEV